LSSSKKIDLGISAVEIAFIYTDSFQRAYNIENVLTVLLIGGKDFKRMSPAALEVA
jgi:hypothetical protein